jgi:hypothetical protein
LLPQNYKPDNVSSTLSSDGLLTICAVNPAIQGPKEDFRSVPISHVGPQKESVQNKTEEEKTTQPKIEQVN